MAPTRLLLFDLEYLLRTRYFYISDLALPPAVLAGSRLARSARSALIASRSFLFPPFTILSRVLEDNRASFAE